MENSKLDIEEILSVQKQLKSENLEKIDFDLLVTQLEQVQTLYDDYQDLNKEFAVLKENVVQKITSMEKAVQVVTKKRPNIKELEESLQELSVLNASELLKEFHKSETKFHAAFPSTFSFQHKKNNISKDYKSYK